MTNPILDFGKVMLRVDVDNQTFQLSSDGGRTWTDSTAQVALAAGSVTNDHLAGGISGDKLADGAVGATQLAAGAVALDKLISAGLTQGDTLVLGAAGWQALAAGAVGQVLTGQGAGQAPAWAAGPISIMGARVTNNNTVTIPSSSLTEVSWTAERFDTGGFWDVANPARLTVPLGQGGIYLVGCSIAFNNSSISGYRSVYLKRSTSPDYIAADSRAAVTGETLLTIATAYQLAEGEYVTLHAYQNSGSSLNLDPFPMYSKEFWLLRLA